MQIGGRHVISSGCSSPPPPAADYNRNETEAGDHKAALRQKKLKAKTLKWTSSNKDMNSKAKGGGSEGIYDDTVLCSLTTATFNSLISRKRVRTLGKVAQQCDATDPPVPRRLRSVINKRARHVKKRRHLSAISAQISFADQRTKLNETSLLTEEEEVADALLSLSQIPSTCEFTADKVIADSTNRNVSSTSYSEGTTKEGDKITVLPNADYELSKHGACIVERTENLPRVNSVPGARNQPNNVNPPLLENAELKNLPSGVVANLPSPCKDSSTNNAQKQLEVQLDDGKNYAAQKPDARLVDSNKSDNLMHEIGKAKSDSAQEIIHRVQAPLPCTPVGYLVKPSSSKLTVQASTVSEFSKVTASGNLDKLPLVKSGVPTKAWKRSITHVYVSHLIQMHLDKEKATHCQVKPEERSHIQTSSRSPTGSTLHKSNAEDQTCYPMHVDVRLPVQQPSTGICGNMSGGRQKTVSGNFLTSTALQGAQAQHVQYLHPQMAPPRGPMPYPFPHLQHSRANLAPAATLHQMQQYMCNPGYAPCPGLTAANSSAMMKLQQLIPTYQQQQQQQQMWQFHVAQYQPRPDAGPPGAAWQNMRPMSMLPTPAMTPQMELLCAPYQGGSRQPQQLRLM
ncbi:hypothetical protein QOZ80_2BG0153130 [Eleusine coracana subsp. coracana]|nr:hypothetical protein QOZ80_2BG0153130 [Eleusine coracana subsp. coracana]